MLTFFQMRKTFHKLTVTLTVDAEAKEAEVMVKYDRVIIRMETVPFWEVRDATLADRWLSRPMGERGNYIEYLEWMARVGILKREAA